MARKRTHKRSRGFGKGDNLLNEVGGAALYGLTRGYIKNILPDVFPNSDNIIMGGGALLLKPKTSGLIRGYLQAAVIVESALLATSLMSSPVTPSNSNFGLAPYNSGYSY